MAYKHLTEILIDACKDVGISNIRNWFKYQQIDLPSVNKIKNQYEMLEYAIENKSITIELLQSAVVDLLENSDKKIYLFNTINYKNFELEKKAIINKWRQKFFIKQIDKNFVYVKPKQTSTFNYIFWENNVLKIKFSELHFDVQANYETEQFERKPVEVAILYLIDTSDGFVQIRMDNARQVHLHKDNQAKPSQTAYENFYINLFIELFSDFSFKAFDLEKIVRYILINEKKKFCVTKEISTIEGGAKQSFAAPNFDVRDLTRYKDAESKGDIDKLNEDLIGNWLQSESGGELEKNLFMRIWRKENQIRIQRGCLEKELNYGLKQIREIQAKV